jgi:hypothetical protein
MLINLPQNQTQSLTPDKDRMIQINTNGYNAMKNTFEASSSILGRAPNPQVILDQWGTGAVGLFIAAQATEDLLKILNPAYEAPVFGHSYTPNPDGTVTYNPPEEE